MALPLRPLLPLAVVAVAALFLDGGPVSPLMLALVAGVLCAQLPWSTASIEVLGKTTLRLGVVLLGLRLSADVVAQVGLAGIVIVVATIAATYIATQLVGRWLGVEEDLRTLVAVGFSICGAAAIAGVQDLVRARREAVAQAVAMVTIFGSAMILIVPAVTRLLELSDRQAAVWAGASVHEVAQVVAAASAAAPLAVGIAVSVKLLRVVALAPMSLVVSRAAGGPRGVPWFVVGFVIAVLIRTTGLLPAGVLDLADHATTALLAAGMFALGLGVRLSMLARGTGRLAVLSAVSTGVAAGVSFLLVAWLV
ncbi:putative sulfate exporter family transporter [Aeromicrobium sp. YIM 150415]|uniref:YeiH family protein n=1 Tax=Aeromicrobium sp. YIM 150415 TaxID=2803912 RepID=UPI0019649B46|nr:putative sulfate exporter family transporter [Aeromicrobium sp. YIM 150415]MBM9462392.1 putative sulfate exporter family transporter [Aeromicrobium sp. YIM 150415]